MGRGIARGLAFAALTAAFALPSAAADTLHVGKASPTAIAMVPVDVGAKLGFFDKHGLAVEIADFAGGAKLHQAMAAGSVDIGIGAGPLAFQMEEQKVGRLLFPVSDYAGNLSAATIFASRRLIETNPDAIRRFLAGWFDAVDFMRRDKAETVWIASAMTGFSATVQAKECDLTITMFNTDCRFDAESLATLKRSFADLKLLDFAPDMTKLYTEEFLPNH